MGNKIKKYIITAIVGVVISELVWILAIGGISIYAMDQADIIDMDELFGTGSGGSRRTVIPGNVAGLLQAAEMIAKYMSNNGYKYSWSGLTTRYNDPGSGTSCCATYVSWCLQEAGLIDDSQHNDNVCGDNGDRGFNADSVPGDGVWRVLYDNPKWQKVVVKDESEMRPGDVVIYKTGKSHTNIYAGNGEYWDAGSNGNGAFVGQTMPHSIDGYTCSYRYIGD